MSKYDLPFINDSVPMQIPFPCEDNSSERKSGKSKREKTIKPKYKEEDFADRFSSPCFGNFVPPEKARKQQKK